MPLRSTLINPGSCCTKFHTWNSLQISTFPRQDVLINLIIFIQCYHEVATAWSFRWNVWRISRVPFTINHNHLENFIFFHVPIITTQHLLTKITTGHRSPTAKVLNVVRKLIPDVRNTHRSFFSKLVWSCDVGQFSVLVSQWVFFSRTETKPSTLFKNSDRQSFMNAKAKVLIFILGSLIISKDCQLFNHVLFIFFEILH